jgi:hypothetical protein
MKALCRLYEGFIKNRELQVELEETLLEKSMLTNAVLTYADVR